MLQEYIIHVSLYWFAHDYFDQSAASGDLAHDTPNLLIALNLKMKAFPFLNLDNKNDIQGIIF